MDRRHFLKRSAAAGIAANSLLLSACSSSTKRLRVLVLGGTQFVGPAVVNAALKAGHEVTLFNRGITNPQLFGDLRLIKGDREQGIAAYRPLTMEKWDIVIDVWPEVATLVDEATSALQDVASHYVFISSIAVYNNFQEVGLHEESRTVSLDTAREQWTYSEEKAAAEQLVRERFLDRHTLLRPGPIKGWRDPAFDLLYWCIKLQRDDAIIAPGSGNDPLQFIDVKDVGRFAVHAASNGLSGTYNVTGPTPNQVLWKDFLVMAKAHLQSNTDLVWVDEAFLGEHNVYSFSDLPLWAPLSEDKGFMQISNKKLVNTGFQLTPISQTLDDCLKWHQAAIPTLAFGTEEVGVGLAAAREQMLLTSYRESIKQDL